MKLFDLHCDSIYRALMEHKSLFDGDLCVNLKKISEFEEYNGCFAIWIPEDYTSQEARNLFKNAINLFKSYKIDSSKIFLTVEGGKILENDIANIDLLLKNNIKVLTLTWNGKCNIGDGCLVKNSRGINDFGRQVVHELEKNNIVIDLSHASEKLFYDVCEISSKSFICSHSNSKIVYDHLRNISGDQFEILKERKGLVGVNFCKDFLSSDAKLDDIFSHIEHFMSLGGDNCVCIGSDFDGSETSDEIKNILDIHKLYNLLLKKNYSERLVEKIFYYNAYNFFNNR